MRGAPGRRVISGRGGGPRGTCGCVSVGGHLVLLLARAVRALEEYRCEGAAGVGVRHTPMRVRGDDASVASAYVRTDAAEDEEAAHRREDGHGARVPPAGRGERGRARVVVR